MRVDGIRGLLGQVYTVEDGVLSRDDSNNLIPLSGSTSGFYYISCCINYLQEMATCELKIYKSKSRFRTKPQRPYQIIVFSVKNHYNEEGILEFSDFDTYFSDSVTKSAGTNEQRKAIEMLKTFTGSSDFEIRNNIENTGNYASLTDSTM